jgi:Uma2 family endonuclease
MSDPVLEKKQLEETPEAEWRDVPTQNDLLCDDGIPMETHRHRLQMELLTTPLHHWLVANQQQGFVGGNMFVYFSPLQVRNQDYRGPDVFVVLDVSNGDRKSWVVWEEGKAPDVVIELLSDSTAQQDKTAKKQIYQQQLRVPEYFWYDPFNPEDFAGFSLERGLYQTIPFDQQQCLASQQLGLNLVRWQGQYMSVEATWLRWVTLGGELLPTDQERVVEERQRAEEERQRAEEERQRAEEERQRAEEERQRADRLATRLREMGIDPDQV